MFFIDDDQSQICKSRKHGRPCSDTNMTFSLCHAATVITPFSFGEAAVHDNDVISETGRKAAHNLSGQADFRYEDEHLLTCGNDVFCKA
jgi:hypothetical protein